MDSSALFEIIDGEVQQITQIPSPNFNNRPENSDIQLIVIHNISLPPNQFGGGHIQQFFQNQLDWSTHPYFRQIEGMQVSAHFLILRTGEIIQFVNLNQRAWHAGRSSYLGQIECNDYSIGIELEGSDHTNFEPAQYQQLVKLIASLQATYPKIQHHLAGHSDVAPTRKTDPGPYFDWCKLRESLKQFKTSISNR